MRPTISILDRIIYAGSLLLVAVIVMGICLALLRVIGRSSLSRRRHGRYVLGWMVAGWLIGGALGIVLLDNVRYVPGEADVGMAGFGLLCGWVVGMIHGGLTLAFRRGPETIKRC